LDGAVQGADGVRTIIVTIRTLYDRQESGATQAALAMIEAAPSSRKAGKNSLIKSDDFAVSPHFEVVHQSDGRFHWELINPHGTPAARSMETFATEGEAAANAEYARRLISSAPIERS